MNTSRPAASRVKALRQAAPSFHHDSNSVIAIAVIAFAIACVALAPAVHMLGAIAHVFGGAQ